MALLSNISRCVNADGTKIQGLKTHDCHVLLQRIFPAAMRDFLDNDIYVAIAELGKFFRELCSRTLDKDVLTEMKKEIPIILVKLEKISPPLLSLMSWCTLLSIYLMKHYFEVLCNMVGCTQLKGGCTL